MDGEAESGTRSFDPHQLRAPYDERGEQIARRWLDSGGPVRAHGLGAQIPLRARRPEGSRAARHRCAAHRLASGGAPHQDNGVAVDGSFTRRQ